MDGLEAGEAGVLAWCNSIRFNIAKDPGREFLDSQIQKQGFDFLDSYLDNVFSRSKEEPVYELLKTPGKKRDAPKRTRAATAAVAKLKAINSLIFDDTEPEVQSHSRSATGSSSQEDSSSKAHMTAIKKKAQKVVTVVDTPEPHKMDVDDGADPAFSAEDIPAPQFFTGNHSLERTHSSNHNAAPQHSTQPASQAAAADNPPAELKPVDIPIVVDNAHAPEHDIGEDDLPLTETLPEDPIVQHESLKELSMIAEDEEPNERSRLSPVRTGVEEIPERESEDEDMAVPIRDVPHDPMDQDITVPLRDVPGPSTLKRKGSVSTFSGLPAPSPLRKSMRMSHEPTLAHTPGTGLGGAGKRTSWLTQAKQAKALEFGSNKRVASMSSATTLGSNIHADKAKSGDTFGLGFTFASTESLAAEAVEKMDEDGETTSEALAFLRGKRKAASLEDNTTRITPLPQPKAQSPHPVVQTPAYDYMDDLTVPVTDPDNEEHTLYRLKMTVEGARAGKHMGKSLGGNAAAELAEARAKAEAKIAQRNKPDGSETVDETGAEIEQTDASTKQPNGSTNNAQEEAAQGQGSPVPAEDPSRRMSLSDLVSDQEQSKTHTSAKDKHADLSTSTTPPHSPPAILSKAPAAVPPPVFSKPPTVFVAPPPRQPKEVPSAGPSKEPVFKMPVAKPFSLPVQTTLGIPATLSSQKSASGLSSQPSKTSLFSDAVFDKEENTPAWMTATQDTKLSQNEPAGSQKLRDDGEDDMDEDDSWHVDEQFKANQMWTPFGFTSADKDDTMTWSTLPSRSTSQKGGDTGPMPSENLGEEAHKAASDMLKEEAERAKESETEAKRMASDLDSDLDKAQGEIDEEDLQMDDMEIDEDYPASEMELEDIAAAGQSTVGLVKQPPRAPSQQSMASTSSSQSQLGFFGQASRLVSSVLGSSKTKKPEPVKSVARAAAVAKKQQEEADKKAARLKDMENRRQLAQQRKADEEKARAEEEAKKIKEEADRRKREKDENTDKRPLKPTKQAEEDTTKKRKINADAEKKAEPTKPPSKDAQSSRSIKPPSASIKAPATATKVGGTLKTLSKQASTTSLNAAASSSTVPKGPTTEPKSNKITASSSSSKLPSAKGKTKANPDKDDELPSKVVQGQMANRAKAQMQAVQTPRQAPPVTSESIELPDINSEYSDSDDENRPRTFDPPDWARSPELRQQLEDQSRMNPDNIFGRIGPLRMEEIFRTRQSRFRARTSSANWAGADQLTAEEEEEYARRMGFR